ncbi:glycine zipper 2TM domain-containing protein [Thalassomonas haliotis]|uniref:Glycine zipper 2TM domain-containing protein n=1 Tax=Thalassomonas haliotis TaxID=485448 RepID=A0ABY7VJE5_9GAMM|nr:glycine zipper 2TM domain-containing protein [Thalassomonas haliotis]WDE13090.1 glycine zipper 2TM domain-containing protein [Thalassomonas haliotis]
MKKFLLCFTLFFTLVAGAQAQYERNKAVPVEKVLFGQVLSVRDISEQELIQDQNHGWKVFGGALIGGVIGNQFGSGSGRTAATILGALLGGSVAGENNPEYTSRTLALVELMIRTEDNKEYMVVQDYDSRMVFSAGNDVRMVYLANGLVRIDKQM